jgi:hypothetical protein
MSSSARARVRARVRNKEKDALECNAVWNRAQRDATHQVQCVQHTLVLIQYKIQNYTSSTWKALFKFWHIIYVITWHDMCMSLRFGLSHLRGLDS